MYRKSLNVSELLLIILVTMSECWEALLFFKFSLRTPFLKELVQGLLPYLAFFSNQLVDTINNFEVILATRGKESNAY